MGQKLKLTLLLPEGSSHHSTAPSQPSPPLEEAPPPPPPQELSEPVRDSPAAMKSPRAPEPASPDGDRTQPPMAEKSRTKQLQKKNLSDVARFLHQGEKRKSPRSTQVLGPSLQQLSSFDSSESEAHQGRQSPPSFYTGDGDDGSTVFQISSSSGTIPDLGPHISEAAARPSKKPRLVHVPQQQERRRRSVVKPYHRPDSRPARVDSKPPVKIQLNRKRSEPPREMRVRRPSRRR